VVHVRLSWSPHQLQLTVTNGPATQDRRQTPVRGAGHGLIGMRERALTCGGTLTAGRTAAGGFLVQAALPVDGQTHDQRTVGAGPPASTEADDALPAPRTGTR
jgi:signal transduction histidine kinase